MTTSEQNHYNSKICPKCGKEYPKKAISCDKCNITLMKKTTYGRIMNNRDSMILVCPKCKKRYYPPIKSDICENCKVDLISNSEYEHNQTIQTQQFEKRFTAIIITIAVIIGIIIIVCTIQKSNEPKTFVDDKRCWWCSKVIRFDGRNIHGTPTDPLGHIIECEYCGHENVIVE